MKFSQQTSETSCSTSLNDKGDNCCKPQPKGKEYCPICHKKAKGVLGKTLNSLLTPHSKSRLKCLDGFYYCKTPTCKAIYFKSDTVLTQNDLSVSVGIKKGAKPAIVCYCFGWTKEKIKGELQQNGKTNALKDIKAKMKNPGCSCEVLNPSGGCCLSDVSKAQKELKEELGLST